LFGEIRGQVGSLATVARKLLARLSSLATRLTNALGRGWSTQLERGTITACKLAWCGVVLRGSAERAAGRGRHLLEAGCSKVKRKRILLREVQYVTRDSVPL
jgi:hypothetical protein